jgi:COP9 signalosome complex subunit 4
MAMVVGRRVLGAFVIALAAGSGLPKNKSTALTTDEEGSADISTWEKLGDESFSGEKGEEIRMEVVEGVLQAGGISGWCEEQVSYDLSMKSSSDRKLIQCLR